MLRIALYRGRRTGPAFQAHGWHPAFFPDGREWSVSLFGVILFFNLLGDAWTAHDETAPRCPVCLECLSCNLRPCLGGNPHPER